ncbi:MAG: AAA family ATPase, partial [Candidatus Xenobia bacterium]
MLNVNPPQTALPGLRPVAFTPRSSSGLPVPIDQYSLGGLMDASPAPAPAAAAPAPTAAPAPASLHRENYIPDKEKCRMVETKSTIADLESLGRSYKLSHNVLMIGTTGAGKTSRVKYLAALLKKELRRINLSDMTDVTEIIGGYKPGPNGGFEWHDGIVTEAVRKGQWLLLDEINLADPAILERLNPLLDSGRLLVLNEKENEVVKAAPGLRVFATMNPSSYSGRKELSEAMLNRFKRLYVFPPEPDELAQIAQGVLPHWTTEAVPINKLMKDGSIQSISNLNANTECKLLGQRKELDKVVYARVRTNDGVEGWIQEDKLRPDIPQKTLLQMVTFHDTVAKMADQRQIGKRDGPYPYTLRDLLKWVSRIETLKDSSGLPQDQLIYREAKDLYLDRLQNPQDRKA